MCGRFVVLVVRELLGGGMDACLQVVVDEFTYLSGRDREMVLNLKVR